MIGAVARRGGSAVLRCRERPDHPEHATVPRPLADSRRRLRPSGGAGFAERPWRRRACRSRPTQVPGSCWFERFDHCVCFKCVVDSRLPSAACTSRLVGWYAQPRAGFPPAGQQTTSSPHGHALVRRQASILPPPHHAKRYLFRRGKNPSNSGRPSTVVIPKWRRRAASLMSLLRYASSSSPSSPGRASVMLRLNDSCSR